MGRVKSFIQHEPAVPSSFRRSNKLSTIDAIISDMELGQFFSPSLLVDQILRDDRVRGVFEQRCGTLLGKPMCFEAPDDKPKAQQIAEDCEAWWSTIFPSDVLRQLLEWSLFLGVGFAQLKWQRVDGVMVPIAEIWHPSTVNWNIQSQCYVAQHQGGAVEIRMGDPQWLILPRFGLAHAGRRGFLRSVADVYMRRQWTEADWSRFNEVHGLPIRKAIAPASANDDALKTHVAAISRLGSDAAIGLRQDKDSKWDVGLLEATSSSYTSFQLALQMLAQDLAVVVLGQWMSTEGQSGLGSNAKAGDAVRLDLQLADAQALGECLYEQVLRPFVAYNYGDADLAPFPSWQVAPPEDLAAKAAQLLTLGDAIAKWQAAGLQVDLVQSLEQRDIVAVAGAEVIEPPEPPETQPEAEPPVEDKQPAEPPAEGEISKQRVRGADAARVPAQRAQRELDSLVHKATVRGAQPMVRALDHVRAAVTGAGDFADAQARLLLALERMSARDLTEVVSKAQILAELRGRVTAVEEVRAAAPIKPVVDHVEAIAKLTAAAADARRAGLVIDVSAQLAEHGAPVTGKVE